MADETQGGALSRREFGVRVGMAGACLAMGRPRPSRAEQAGKDGDRPNIVFLLTDDQRWDAMGCAGNPIIQTPNMDKLAGSGVRFDNAFVTTSICMASRASIFTGQYERRHGCTFGRPPLSDEVMSQTYPALLRKAGYRTGFVGKFGVSVPKARRWFDVWHGFGGQGKYENKDKQGNPKHLTRIMGDQAVGFIRGCKPDQPFCLSVSFKAPHCQDGDPRQFIYDPVYKNLYGDTTIPVPKTAAACYFDRLPKFLKESEGRKRWKIRFATPEMHQESVKSYYRLVTGVDAAIGRIRDELERRSLDRSTIMVFIADNGFYLGERGLAGKWYAHEESIRVPLIVYDPRRSTSERGRTMKEMALNIDVAPTLLEMAGLPVPKTMQGRSLVGLMAGTCKTWRKDFFYEHLFERHNIPKSEGVRTERWKYIRYFEQQPMYEELYDLVKDPFEEDNLVGNVDHRATLETLRKRCDELRDLAKGPPAASSRTTPERPADARPDAGRLH